MALSIPRENRQRMGRSIRPHCLSQFGVVERPDHGLVSVGRHTSTDNKAGARPKCGTTLAARFPHLGVERCHCFCMHRHAGREARRVNAAATSLGGLATCLGADLSWPGLSGPIRTRPSWCGGISRPGFIFFPEQSPGFPLARAKPSCSLPVSKRTIARLTARRVEFVGSQLRLVQRVVGQWQIPPGNPRIADNLNRQVA